MRNTVLIWYALMGLPMAMATLPFALHVPNLYTAHIGLSLGAVGSALVVARLLDLLVDPLLGALADRWHLFGTWRKGWVAVAILPVTLGAYQVLTPTQTADVAYLFMWSLVFYVGWTMLSIPYQSWGAELSDNYYERARIRTWVECFTTVGTILAAAAPLLVEGNERQALFGLGVGLAIAFPALGLLMLWRVPEPTHLVRTGFAPEWQAWRNCLNNRHFRPLAWAYLINGIGDALSAVVVLYYIAHVIRMPDLAGVFLGALFASGLCSVFIWLRISYRLGKHQTWRLSLLWGMVFFAGIPFLGADDFWFYLLLCIGGGSAFAADAVLPPTMLADVVDADTAVHGVQRTGLYFALWAMLTKLALAISAGFALWYLQFWGFDAVTGGTETGQRAVAWLYGLGPFLLRIIAFWIMRNYQLDANTQSGLAEKIRHMQQ